MSKQAFFLIPIFNESENIGSLKQDMTQLAKIVGDHSFRCRFVIVDDGSTDDSFQQLNAIENHEIQVVRHDVNKGPGAAFQSGFEKILQLDLTPEDIVITLEGDATSNPSFLNRMLLRLQEKDDIILASPYLYGGGFSQVTGFRTILSHGASIMTKIFLKIRGIATFSCFFRLYTIKALKLLSQQYSGKIVESQGFECAAEILSKAVILKLPVSEIPFHVDWSRRKGKSKMKVMKTTLGYFRLFYRASNFYGRKTTSE